MNPRKPRDTTHHQHLPEKVTIVRVRHLFEGRSLNVLGVTHRKGQLHLVLILPDGSKSLIPADWTDLTKPTQIGSKSRSVQKSESRGRRRSRTRVLLVKTGLTSSLRSLPAYPAKPQPH